MLHKVTINGLEDEEKLKLYHGLKKMMFEAGEKVEFFVVKATDTSYSVTAANARVSCDDGRNYSFYMPEEDVDVNVTSRSCMMNNMNNMPFSPAMGMMGMGGLSMEQVIRDSEGRNLMEEVLWPKKQ